jgi:hypothetical protein
MEKIKKLLGRDLKPMEIVIYNMYKDSLNYSFYVDTYGNLIATTK